MREREERNGLGQEARSVYKHSHTQTSTPATQPETRDPHARTLKKKTQSNPSISPSIPSLVFFFFFFLSVVFPLPFSSSSSNKLSFSYPFAFFLSFFRVSGTGVIVSGVGAIAGIPGIPKYFFQTKKPLQCAPLNVSRKNLLADVSFKSLRTSQQAPRVGLRCSNGSVSRPHLAEEAGLVGPHRVASRAAHSARPG